MNKIVFTAAMAILTTVQTPAVMNMKERYFELLYDQNVREAAAFCRTMKEDEYKLHATKNAKWSVSACYYVERQPNHPDDTHAGDASFYTLEVYKQV